MFNIFVRNYKRRFDHIPLFSVIKKQLKFDKELLIRNDSSFFFITLVCLTIVLPGILYSLKHLK